LLTNPLLVIICQHCCAIGQWFDFSLGPGYALQQEWAEVNANDISADEDGVIIPALHAAEILKD
jgi:hypothetical protein